MRRALLAVFFLFSASAHSTILFSEDWTAYADGTNITSLTPAWVRTNTFTGDQVTVVTYGGLAGSSKATNWPSANYWMHQMYSGATYTYTSMTVQAGPGRLQFGLRAASTGGTTYQDGGYVFDTTGELWKVDPGGGNRTVLATGTFSPVDGTNYRITIVANGSSLAGYLNGSSTPYVTATDATYTSGYVGVNSFQGNTHIGKITVEDGVITTPTSTPTATMTFTATLTPTITPTQVPCGAIIRIYQIGDSFQLGNGCAQTEAGEVGLRPDLINDLQFKYGRSAYMLGGDYGAGQIACNRTDAVSGQTTATELAGLLVALPTRFPTPTANDVVLIGGGTAGEILGESGATITANWDAMMDTIAARSRRIKMVLINPAWNPSYDYTLTYTAWQNSIQYARSKGYNVAAFDPVKILGKDVNNVCANDSLHPRHMAQVAMGHGLAQVVAAMFGGAAGAPWGMTDPFPFVLRRRR